MPIWYDKGTNENNKKEYMMKPQILFEDAEILVCHKPAGTAVQTASFSAQDMVSICLLYTSDAADE